MKKFEKVFVAGTFDFLHIGHQYLLWTAVNSAKSLVVIVARDQNVLRIKGRKPHFTEQQRIERIYYSLIGQNIEGINSTESLVPREVSLNRTEFLPHTEIKLGGESLDEFLQTLADQKPDAIMLGYDQQLRFPAGKIAELGIEILRCDPFHPQFFKSSYFRPGVLIPAEAGI